MHGHLLVYNLPGNSRRFILPQGNPFFYLNAISRAGAADHVNPRFGAGPRFEDNFPCYLWCAPLLMGALFFCWGRKFSARRNLVRAENFLPLPDRPNHPPVFISFI